MEQKGNCFKLCGDLQNLEYNLNLSMEGNSYLFQTIQGCQETGAQKFKIIHLFSYLTFLFPRSKDRFTALSVWSLLENVKGI